MNKKVLLFILLMIVFPISIKAYCKTEDKMRLTNLANNVSASYDYVESNDSVSFSITLHNVHRDLLLVNKDTNATYRTYNNEPSDIKLDGFADGKNYSFYIKSNNNSDCSSTIFHVVYVSIPKYNKYYNDPVCKGAENYKLCQKWGEIGSYSYDQFVSEVTEYKTPKVTMEQIEIEKKSLINIIGDFWAKYYLYILISVIVLCSIIIFIRNKKNSFDF